MELEPPCEPDFGDGAGKPTRQPTSGSSQLDYFCQMVDYMKTSMSMRASYPLNAEGQAIFDDFDFVSNKVFEEELHKVRRCSRAANVAAHWQLAWLPAATASARDGALPP